MKASTLTGVTSFLSRVLFLVLTLSVFVSIFFPQLFPFTQEEAANWIESHACDKLIFVGIQIVQVVIPPISHYFTSILGGYIYGPIEGGVLNWIGRVIGQYIAFGLAYRLAGWLEKKKSTNLKLFQHLVGGGESNLYLRALIIFVMIALPFFPDDELSYAMGFARFSLPLFTAVTIFGHLLGSFALAFLGSGQDFRGPLFIALASFTVLFLVSLIWASVKFRRVGGRSDQITAGSK